MIIKNPEGFLVLVVEFGYAWPVSLFAISAILIIISLAKVKKRKVNFPFKYSILSFYFTLILIVYAYFPPAYNLDYSGDSSLEYFTNKTNIEKPIYYFVGLVLLFNLLISFGFVVKSGHGNRLLTAFVMILMFQISGMAGVYALDSVLVAGLD